MRRHVAAVTREEYDDMPASWYVKLTAEPVHLTVEQQRTVNIDYDKDGHVIGVEIV